jgi:hypothetical protein
MKRSLCWKVILKSIFAMARFHASAGEMFIGPKGVEHKPYAEQEVKLLLIEHFPPPKVRRKRNCLSLRCIKRTDRHDSCCDEFYLIFEQRI